MNENKKLIKRDSNNNNNNNINNRLFFFFFFKIQYFIVFCWFISIFIEFNYKTLIKCFVILYS